MQLIAGAGAVDTAIRCRLRQNSLIGDALADLDEALQRRLDSA